MCVSQLTSCNGKTGTGTEKSQAGHGQKWIARGPAGERHRPPQDMVERANQFQEGINDLLSEEQVNYAYQHPTSAADWVTEPWIPDGPVCRPLQANGDTVLKNKLTRWVLMESDDEADDPPAKSSGRQRTDRKVAQLNRRRTWVAHGMKCDVTETGIQHRPKDWYADQHRRAPLHHWLVASRQSAKTLNIHEDIKNLLSIARDGQEQATPYQPKIVSKLLWTPYRDDLKDSLACLAWKRGYHGGFQLRTDMASHNTGVVRLGRWHHPVIVPAEDLTDKRPAPHKLEGPAGNRRTFPGLAAKSYLTHLQSHLGTALYPPPISGQPQRLGKQLRDVQVPGTWPKAKPSTSESFADDYAAWRKDNPYKAIAAPTSKVPMPPPAPRYRDSKRRRTEP